MYYRTAIVILLCIFACKPKPCNPLGAESAKFNNYLQQQFHTSPGADTMVYILVSTDGCNGCLESIFSHAVKKQFASNVRVIVSSKTVMKYDLQENEETFWVDTGNHVDKMAYHKGNVALIKTHDNQIVSIQPVEPIEAGQLLKPLIKR